VHSSGFGMKPLAVSPACQSKAPKNLTYAFNSHSGTVSVSPQLTPRRIFVVSHVPAITVIASTRMC
jgi:hypothetical protein